jgi:hypothetical protein
MPAKRHIHVTFFTKNDEGNWSAMENVMRIVCNIVSITYAFPSLCWDLSVQGYHVALVRSFSLQRITEVVSQVAIDLEQIV